MSPADLDCSACGAGLSRGDAFCSQCGTRVATGGTGPGVIARQPEVAPDRAWFRRRVEDLEARGWRVEHDHGDRVVLVDRGFGSLPAHLVLFALTGGVGNLLYAWHRRTSGAPRREVRADGTERPAPGDDRRGVDPWTAGGVVLGLLFAVVAAITLAAGAVLGASELLTLVAAGLFLLIGVTVAYVPFVARESDVPPTALGRRRTVSTQRVSRPPEPCAACGDRVLTGVRRGYADRWYLAGLPLRTYGSGENVYCRTCSDGGVGSNATGGVDASDLDVDSERGREELTERA